MVFCCAGDQPCPPSTSARAYFTQRVRRQQAADESNFSAVQLPTLAGPEAAAAEAELTAEEVELGGAGEEEELGAWRHRIMRAEELEALEVRGPCASVQNKAPPGKYQTVVQNKAPSW